MNEDKSSEPEFRRPPKGWTPENAVPYETDPAEYQPLEIKPPSAESRESKFQKGWLSPSGNLHYLDGFIHEQWARLAIGSDVSAPMPHEGGENAKQKLFECHWVRVALHGADTIAVEYHDKAELSKEQSSRLIELATGAGAKYLVRDRSGKMECIWSRDTEKPTEPEWMAKARENSRQRIKRGHLGGILIVEQDAAFDAEANYRRPPKGWNPKVEAEKFKGKVFGPSEECKQQNTEFSLEGNSAPMPHESGANANQKPFEDCGWVHLAFRSPDIIVVEYENEIGLSKLQLSRLIELATDAGANHLMADRGGKMECIWSRDTTSPLG